MARIQYGETTHLEICQLASETKIVPPLCRCGVAHARCANGNGGTTLKGTSMSRIAGRSSPRRLGCSRHRWSGSKTRARNVPRTMRSRVRGNSSSGVGDIRGHRLARCQDSSRRRAGRERPQHRFNSCELACWNFLHPTNISRTRFRCI